MPSSAWAFSLRRPAADYDSDSDTDQPPPPTVEEQVQRELDLSAREDHAKFKSTPWTIAKVNAAARSESLPEKPPPPAAPASRSKPVPSGSKPRGTLQFPVVKRPQYAQKNKSARQAPSDPPQPKEEVPAPRPFPLFAADSAYNLKRQQSPSGSRSVDPSSDDVTAPSLFPPETVPLSQPASAIPSSMPGPALIPSPQLQPSTGLPSIPNAPRLSEIEPCPSSPGCRAAPAHSPPPTPALPIPQPALATSNPDPSPDLVRTRLDGPEDDLPASSGLGVGPSIVVFPVSTEPSASAKRRIHPSPSPISSTRRPFVPLVRQSQAPSANPAPVAPEPCGTEVMNQPEPHTFSFPEPDLEVKQQSSLTRHRGSDFIRRNPEPPQFRPRPPQTFAIPSTPYRGLFSHSSPGPPQQAVFAVPRTPALPRISEIPSTPSRTSFSRGPEYPPERPRFATPAPPVQRTFAVPSTPIRPSFSRSSQSPYPPERATQQQALVPPSTPSRASFSRSLAYPVEQTVFAPSDAAPPQPKPFAVPSTPRASFSRSSPYPPSHEREVFARPATPVRPNLSAPSPRKRGSEFLPPAPPARLARQRPEATPSRRRPTPRVDHPAPTQRGIDFLRPSSPVFRLPAAPARPSASPTKPSAYRNPAFYDTDAEWSTLPARKKPRVEKPAIRSTGKFVLPLAAASAPTPAVPTSSAGPSYLPPPPPPARMRVREVEPKWRLTRVAADDYGLQLPDIPHPAPVGQHASAREHEVAVDLGRIERVYPTMRKQLAE